MITVSNIVASAETIVFSRTLLKLTLHHGVGEFQMKTMREIIVVK